MLDNATMIKTLTISILSVRVKTRLFVVAVYFGHLSGLVAIPNIGKDFFKTSKLLICEIVKLDLSIDYNLLRLNATLLGKLVVFVDDLCEFFFSFFHDSIMTD